MSTKRKILLSFIGIQDPYSNKHGNEGPILSLLKHSPVFTDIVLFSVGDMSENVNKLKTVLSESYPNIAVQIIPLDTNDPTSYEDIIQALRNHIPNICTDLQSSEYYISIASGTPAMYVCWFLLSASGEIPANILYIKPAVYTEQKNTMIQEINPRAPVFPNIRPYISLHSLPDDIPDSNTVKNELGIIGDDPSLIQVLDKAALIARSDQNSVLITGESGTGKESLAHYIHKLSKRRDSSMLTLNCAGLPETLAESELFGHVRGAFTSANRDHRGHFEIADGGTLFLDEIGDLPLSIQAKLLRAVQFGEFRKVGSDELQKSDVRIICATNRDLHTLTEKCEFREDLYHRISTHKLQIPPLRERRSDIRKLALHFLECEYHNHKVRKEFTPEALSLLERYSWPGNVRDLINVVKRAHIEFRENSITPNIINEILRDLRNGVFKLPDPYDGFSLKNILNKITEHYYSRALDLCNNNNTKAANILGITSQAVSKYKRKHI